MRAEGMSPEWLRAVVLLLSALSAMSSDCVPYLSTFAEADNFSDVYAFQSVVDDPFASQYMLTMHIGDGCCPWINEVHKTNRTASWADTTPQFRGLTGTHTTTMGNDGDLLSAVGADSPLDLCLSQDGLLLAVLNSNGSAIYIAERANRTVDWRTVPIVRFGGTGTAHTDGNQSTAQLGQPSDCVVTPDKTGIVFADATPVGMIRIIHRSNTSMVWQDAEVSTIHSLGTETAGVAIDPKGYYLMFTGLSTSSLYYLERFDLADTAWSMVSVVSTLLTGLQGPRDVALSRDESYVAIASHTGNNIIIWTRLNTSIHWTEAETSTTQNYATTSNVWQVDFIETDYYTRNLALAATLRSGVVGSKLVLLNNICCNCTGCQEGLEFVNNTCLPCGKGKFSSHVGQQCSFCAPGTFSDITGQSSCTYCPEGKYSSGHGATSCLNCPWQSSSPKSSNNISDCICNAGFESDGPPLAFNCTPCKSGTYKSVDDLQCLLCPVNSTSPFGSSSITSCVCNVGLSGPNGGQCQACEAGKYKNFSGEGNCTTCPPSSTSETGSKAFTDCLCLPGQFGSVIAGCQPCGLGTFSTLGSLSCESCGPGTYQDKVGSSTCLKCPQNSNSTMGSIDLSNCTCGAGHTPLDGSCIPCPSGTYKNLTGTTECLSCPSGTISPAGSVSEGSCQLSRICQSGSLLYNPHIPDRNSGTVVTLLRSPDSWVSSGQLVSSSFQPTDVVIGRTEEFAVVSSEDGNLYILNSSSSDQGWINAELEVVDMDGKVPSMTMDYLALSPDDLTLAISSGSDISVLQRSHSHLSWSESVVKNIFNSTQVFGLDFGHDGSYLVIAVNGTNSTYDSSNNRMVTTKWGSIDILFLSEGSWSTGSVMKPSTQVVGWSGLEPRDVSVSSDGLFIVFIDLSVHGVVLLSRSSTSVEWTSSVMQKLVSGGSGYLNGEMDVARFSSPSYISISPDKLSILVSDTGNNAIRLIQRQSVSQSWTKGHVSTVSGRPQLSGMVPSDGTQTTAVFNNTKGVDISRSLEVLVGDTGILRILNDTLSGCTPCPSGSLIPNSEYYLSGSCEYRCQKGAHDAVDVFGGPNFCEKDALLVEQIFEGNSNFISMRLTYYESLFDTYMTSYLRSVPETRSSTSKKQCNQVRQRTLYRDKLDGFLLDSNWVTRNGIYGRFTPNKDPQQSD